MSETVGNHQPFENEQPNKPSHGVQKCFEFYANLLTFEAPKAVRKFKEFIVLNDDKTFSLMEEQIFLDGGGNPHHYRMKSKLRFHTLLRLSQNYTIDPQILISLN